MLCVRNPDNLAWNSWTLLFKTSSQFLNIFTLFKEWSAFILGICIFPWAKTQISFCVLKDTGLLQNQCVSGGHLHVMILFYSKYIERPDFFIFFFPKRACFFQGTKNQIKHRWRMWEGQVRVKQVNHSQQPIITDHCLPRYQLPCKMKV